MLDDWVTRLLTLAASVVMTPSGAITSAIATIGGPARGEAAASRGDRQPVDDPPLPAATAYGLPVADTDRAAWGTTHSTYPATDVFVGCGAALVSPVHGTALEVRGVDEYDPAVDNPATRGGKSVAILGDDGVRYYLAHFATIVDDLAPGDPVELGQVLGTMGDTGRTSACHLHFSISPPCPGREWSVRRGAIWPHPYLDAWRAGEQRSPAAEIAQWVREHPTACADAMADPYAPDS